MHSLFLLRHAEAVSTAESDRARSLTAKGREDAAVLARKMVALRIIPDYVVCSPAKRAQETCGVLMETLPQVSIIYPEYLYEASKNDLFKAIGSFSYTGKTVLVIGHNPAMHSLANFLAQRGDHEAVNAIAYGYKPCTMAIIACDINDWMDIQPKVNFLRHVFTAP